MKKYLIKYICINISLIIALLLFLFLPPLINTRNIGTFSSSGAMSPIMHFTLNINNSSKVHLSDGTQYNGDWYVKYTNKTEEFDIFVKYGDSQYRQLRRKSEGIFYYVHNSEEFYIKTN